MNENQFELNKNKFIQTCCKGCYKQLQSNDYVIRLNESYLYHLNCFKCSKCSINILPGKKYGLIKDNLYCDEHYHAYMQNNRNSLVKIESNEENLPDFNYLKFMNSESSSLASISPNFEDFSREKTIISENIIKGMC